VNPSFVLSKEFLTGMAKPWWEPGVDVNERNPQLVEAYEAQLRRLYSTNMFLRVKLGLKNVRTLDTILGHP